MIEQLMEQVFENKKAYHKRMAEAPFEEKLKKLVELQKIKLAMKKSKGEPIKSFEVVWPI